MCLVSLAWIDRRYLSICIPSPEQRTPNCSHIIIITGGITCAGLMSILSWASKLRALTKCCKGDRSDWRDIYARHSNMLSTMFAFYYICSLNDDTSPWIHLHSHQRTYENGTWFGVNFNGEVRYIVPSAILSEMRHNMHCAENRSKFLELTFNVYRTYIV